ncbi:restriction endonuclease [Burkholderia cenocepacia]|uniref:restriction endonuclease n=1 Tax=Burkholderia cenocepacia TaxID=95486 RepID=UPI00222F849D|nr:restriction endonuclease [Burkholderia cenocepacia]MCW3505856.1 restriction endonuclease [Burkholderia cenocepacia]MCW3513434.1 restriction endonuclease [Burkholderia cenocepacia]MCW3520999.1 restriction endonuclease [Burkholderia cenocepacia]MCW3536157.1 restriction endonuclease [Burkholderia cenocepacia]MCW3551220.1 restriction endonuclease [Burkholderia cenocepacia]
MVLFKEGLLWYLSLRVTRLARLAFTLNHRANMTARELAAIGDTEFENLTFDLMVAHGMVNVTWRTPGADGGRDIEGNIIHNDFSLTQTTQKWYVECKRYAGSVDWPTIYKKLAFAESNSADVLLLCTTAKFTPTAITEVAKWNNLRKGAAIRLWPGHQIEILLSKYQDIAWKYGLENTPTPITGSTFDLTLALSKCVSSHHSELSVNDLEISPMLKAAQALSALLQMKMESIQSTGRFQAIFYEPSQYHYPEITISDSIKSVDGPSMTAFLGYLTALRVDLKSVDASPQCTCLIVCGNEITQIFARYKKSFDAIALWGDFEYTIVDKTIKIMQR